MKLRLRHALVLALLTLWLSGCSSTRLVHGALQPGYSGKSFSKVLVAVVAKQPGPRASLELALADQLQQRGIEATASHTFMMEVPQGKDETRQALVKAVQNNGADAVLLVSLIGVDVDKHYVPARMEPVPVMVGPGHGYGPGFGPGYGPGLGYGAFYDVYYDYVYVPGYEESSVDYRLQASFFSVADEALVWDGETSTVNPLNLKSGAASVARTLVGALADEGLLAAGSP